MASNRTEHYGLNQWAGDDNFVRTDFNEDNAKIDTALVGKAEQSVLDALSGEVEARGRTQAGAYVGNGASKQWIDVGFLVKAVLVERPEGYRTSDTGYVSSGMAILGGDLGKENYPLVSVSGNGFFVFQRDNSIGTANANGYTYYFVAFG